MSENYLAFARLLPWVYAQMDDLEQDKPFEEPKDPVSKWKRADCQSFLRERRIKMDPSWKVAELRKLVLVNRNLPPKQAVGGDVKNARMAILSLWAMLSHLMGMRKCSTEGVVTAEQLVRIFLTCCHNFDKQMSADREKEAFWLTAYNFSCLLNIPGQIEALGPVRNRWEGGFRGEGFLRVVKPSIISKRLNWSPNLMKNLLRQKCLLQMKTYDDPGEWNLCLN